MAVADYVTRGWEWIVGQILSRHEKRIQRLEDRMSTLDDKLAEIDAASNREAGTVRDIATALSNLRAEIDSGGIPDDAVARLDGIAAALNARADFLASLAADPNNPIPAPAPDPGPEPAPEPTP
jgi:hypothetical protein